MLVSGRVAVEDMLAPDDESGILAMYSEVWADICILSSVCCESVLHLVVWVSSADGSNIAI